ncbi:MAG: S8 family serine peptidase [Chloroflexota bacterium]
MRIGNLHFAGAILALVLLLLIASIPAGAQPAEEELQAVIIFLRPQPQTQIAKQVWEKTNPRLEQLSSEMRALDPLHQALSKESRPLSRQEEVELVQQFALRPLDAAAQKALKRKAEEMDALRQSARAEIARLSAAALRPSQDRLSQQIEARGGEVVYRYLTLNAIAARIPRQARAELEADPQVAEVMDDQPMEALLNNSTPTTGAPFFWNLGYTGGGVDVAVVDTGIDSGHPALSGKVAAQRRCLSTADAFSSAYLTDPSANDVNGHGTHVAGTIGSQDNTYKGVAYGLRALINAKAGFSTNGIDNSYGQMYDSDAMACVDWALMGNAYGAEVINLSFGSLASVDDYPYNRFYDAVVSQMNTVVAIAAGNSGSGSTTLYYPGTAYNILSVANVDDKNTINLTDYYPTRADDTLRTSSSRGPTPGGRKKPDIAAPGTYIISTDNSWDDYGSFFVSYTGTSMASPHIAGAAALILSRGVTNPLAVKALLINTAEDKGDPGWDNGYGWGYVDLYNLNAHIGDYFSDSISPAPDYRLYAGPALSSDAATLVWNRRVDYAGAQYPGTVYALTNLDLLAYREADNTLLQSSLSTIDNVEQVRFAADETSVVVKVDAVSASFSGASEEAYALAVQEGFSARRGPQLSLLVLSQGALTGPAGTWITVTLQVQNAGDLKAHHNTLTVTPSAGLTQVSGESLNRSLPPLEANESDPMVYQWTFEKTDDQPQTITFSALSSSYDELFPTQWMLTPYQYYFPYAAR